MNDKQYSEEQYEFLTSFEAIENFDMVVNQYAGISSELTTVLDEMMTNIAFEQSDNQKSWTQLRSEYEGIIEGELADFIG